MQVIFSKTFFIILVVTQLSACLSEDHTVEKAQYKKAKQSRELNAQIQALEVLAALEPQEYQTELMQAEEALLQLQQAKSLQKQQLWLASYQLAHDSYRTFSSKEAKEVLATSGKRFVELVKIRDLLVKSYQALPTDLIEQLSIYSQQDVTQWNIVNFNALLKALTKSSMELSRAVSLIKKEGYSDDINLWINIVKAQASAVAQYRNYLVSIAINESGKLLLKHNKELTQEAVELLAYVKPEIAMNGLQPKFNEAYLQYHPHQELMQNIYLAISSAGKKHVVDWYKDWEQTEKAVLMLEGEFSQYVEGSRYRRYILTKIILENTTTLPANQDSLTSIDAFIGLNERAARIVDMLEQDKTLLF